MSARLLILVPLSLALIGCSRESDETPSPTGPVTLDSQTSLEVFALADGGALIVGGDYDGPSPIWYVKGGKAVRVVETKTEPESKVAGMTLREGWLWGQYESQRQLARAYGRELSAYEDGQASMQEDAAIEDAGRY